MSRVEVETEATEDGAPAESTVSMAEVYERMQADARQAQSLAARSGDKLERCSYGTDGVPYTQPVYRCRTCYPDRGDVGVCFGCAMGCHLEHDVEELFERRAFVCDCGTRAAGGPCCQLQPVKADSNPSNVYGQNFRGAYCHCHGGYDAENDVMVCCVLCQDWFHDRCIVGAVLPPDEDDEGGSSSTPQRDFICSSCFANPAHNVLLPYFDWLEREAQQQQQQKTSQQQQEDGVPNNSATNTPSVSRSVSLVTPVKRHSSSFLGVSPAAAAADSASASPAAAASSSPVAVASSSAPSADVAPVEESKEGASADDVLTTPSRKRKADEMSGAAQPATPATPASSVNVCQRATVVAAAAEAAAAAASAAAGPDGAAVASPPAASRDRFVPSDWNQYLCACPTCTEEYRTHGLLWLLDEEEPPAAATTPSAASPAAGAAAAPAAAASSSSSSSSASSSLLARMSAAESSAPVSGAFDPESMGAALVSRLPRSVAIDVLSPFAQFQAAILKGLSDFAQRCPGVVVTKDVMQQIAQQAKQDTDDAVRESKRQRLAGTEVLPE